jgi:hypothetical protein
MPPISHTKRHLCGNAESRARHKTRYRDYGLGNFPEASVQRYWLPKRQYGGGNTFNAKEVRGNSSLREILGQSTPLVLVPSLFCGFFDAAAYL